MLLHSAANLIYKATNSMFYGFSFVELIGFLVNCFNPRKAYILERERKTEFTKAI